MGRTIELSVRAEARGRRLDIYLAEAHGELGLSRARIQALIRAGSVRVEGRAVKPHHRLRGGESVRLEIPDPRPLELAPDPIPLAVLYEDDDLVAVDKPAGMVVHPAAGHSRGTLVHALLHHCADLSGIGGRERPGIVHRLDKGTSGVIVAAKNDAAHRGLAAQIKARSVTKIYVALARGRVAAEQGRIDLPVGRHPRHRKKMAVTVPRGREAVTLFQVRERLPGCTLLELRLLTGRTHQIRVHLAHRGHPVVGDPLYGGRGHALLRAGDRTLRVERPLLHARALGFVHPRTGRPMFLEAPLPPDLQEVLARLRSADP